MTLLQWVPSLQVANGHDSITGIGTQALDGSGDQVAWTLYLEEGATLTHLGFLLLDVDGTDNSLQFDLTLEAIDSNGEPDGVALATATFTHPGASTSTDSWEWVAINAGTYVASAGEYFIRIAYKTGTISASNDITVGTMVGVSSIGITLFSSDTGSNWSEKQVGTGYTSPVVGAKSATKAYGLPLFDVEQSNSVTGVDDIMAYKWNCTKSIDVWGVAMYCYAADGTTVRWGIWNGAGTLLGSATSSNMVDATAGFRRSPVFSSAVSLVSGTDYYIGAELREANALNAFCLEFAAANDATALESANPFLGGGILSKDTAGSWVDTDTKVPMIELLIDLDSIAGGGGGTDSILGGGSLSGGFSG